MKTAEELQKEVDELTRINQMLRARIDQLVEQTGTLSGELFLLKQKYEPRPIQE